MHNILVIDDNAEVYHLVQRMLRRYACQVEWAQDGREALTRLQGDGKLPSLILCDINMPQMDGFQLLEAMRDDPALAKVPVMMLTARHDQKARERAASLGAIGYIQKPFRRTDIVNHVIEGYFGHVMPRGEPL